MQVYVAYQKSWYDENEHMLQVCSTLEKAKKVVRRRAKRDEYNWGAVVVHTVDHGYRYGNYFALYAGREEFIEYKKFEEVVKPRGGI